jgi:hypothetical protein
VTGFGVKGSRRRGQRYLLGMATVAGLLAFTSATAAVSAAASTSTPQQPSVGGPRYGKPIAPHIVTPRLSAARRPLGRQPLVRGGVPPSLAGGIATTGLPPVVSDSPKQGRKLSTAPQVATASGSFASLLAFTGATRAATTCAQCGGEPPDSQTAVGTNEVVQAVNTHVFVYSRGGTALGNFDALDLFGFDANGNKNTNIGLADPKILFDPTSGMYYFTMMVCDAAFCGGSGYTHMSISLAVTSNPLGAWTVYRYINDGANLQDQEKLGFSGDKITFAVNEYSCKCGGGNQFLQENVVVIQKSEAVAGQTIHWVVFHDSSNNSDSTFLFDSMPTTPVNASTSDNTQYVVWDWHQSSGNFMKLVRITGTPDGNDVAISDVTKMDIANQTAPPPPLQQGGTVAGDKQNFQSAMVQGNDLWAVATDGCMPQFPSADNMNRDCTRLVEVDLGSNSVVTDVDIGTTGTYRYNPSVSKDTDGHVFFGFTISSSSTYPTAALDASGLPLPSVLQRIDYGAGDATYTGSRWGDYSGTQQDPADTHDVWSAQEFGACNTGCSNAGGGNWAAAEGQFTFEPPHITSISPTQGPVLGGTTVDIFGSEFANGGTTVTFGGNTSPSVTWLNSTHIQAVSPAGSVGTVDVTATTGAGTSDTSSSDQFTYVKVPTTTTYTGPTSGDYHDSVSLSAQLTNDLNSQGIAGKTLSFTLGAESCSGITDNNGVATCSVTPLDTPGPYTVSVTFGEDASYLGSSASTAFTVNKEETTVAYSGPVVILAGASGATLTATLVEDGSNDNDSDGGSTGLAGKSVTLSIGSQSCPATTDASGNATCTISSVMVPLGPETAEASFAGDAYYQPATATKTAIVFAFPSTGVFTLGDLTVKAATSSTTVTWWNNDWNLLNNLSGGTAPSPFKGFVGTVTLPTTTPVNICAGNWSTGGGNSPPPPATVPSYMGVIVASKITKTSNKINGNYIRIVVVKTNPGYAPGPENSGTGTIVATFCP